MFTISFLFFTKSPNLTPNLTLTPCPTPNTLVL